MIRALRDAEWLTPERARAWCLMFALGAALFAAILRRVAFR